MTLNDKKTVVHVHCSGGIGGTEQYIYNFLTNFRSNKYNTCVLFFMTGGKIADEIKSSGIKTTVLGIKNCVDLIGYIRFYRYLKKTKPTILHIHGPSIPAKITALLFPSIIMVNTDHGPTYHSYSYRRKRQIFFERLLNRFTDQYIAISKIMFKTLIQCGRVNKNKITLIYNGIPIHYKKNVDINKLRESLNVPAEKKILLTVGRLIRQKRIDLLIEAFSKVIKKYPSCCLLLLGEGPDSDDLLRQTKRLKLEDSVFFLGFRRDVPDILEIADVYVCSSEWEAFSISLLEVMLAQKPVVCFNVDGVNEAVKDGTNGYLVPFDNTESFAFRVVQLLNDDNLKKKMGQNGYQRLLEKFSIEKNISETLSLYDKLLAARNIE